TEGDFLFEPGRGGGRIDKVGLADPAFRWRYVQASRFGEVNSYYHVDLVANYVDALLKELGASLPPLTVRVNAHHAAAARNGVRDGVPGTRKWLPFQGGHYRLSSLPSKSDRQPASSAGGAWPGNGSRRRRVLERTAVNPGGEIHLGPGWRLVRYGALAECAG